MNPLHQHQKSMAKNIAALKHIPAKQHQAHLLCRSMVNMLKGAK